MLMVAEWQDAMFGTLAALTRYADRSLLLVLCIGANLYISPFLS